MPGERRYVYCWDAPPRPVPHAHASSVRPRNGRRELVAERFPAFKGWERCRTWTSTSCQVRGGPDTVTHSLTDTRPGRCCILHTIIFVISRQTILNPLRPTFRATSEFRLSSSRAPEALNALRVDAENPRPDCHGARDARSPPRPNAEARTRPMVPVPARRRGAWEPEPGRSRGARGAGAAPHARSFAPYPALADGARAWASVRSGPGARTRVRPRREPCAQPLVRNSLERGTAGGKPWGRASPHFRSRLDSSTQSQGFIARFTPRAGFFSDALTHSGSEAVAVFRCTCLEPELERRPDLVPSPLGRKKHGRPPCDHLRTVPPARTSVGAALRRRARAPRPANARKARGRLFSLVVRRVLLAGSTERRFALHFITVCAPRGCVRFVGPATATVDIRTAWVSRRPDDCWASGTARPSRVFHRQLPTASCDSACSVAGRASPCAACSILSAARSFDASRSHPTPANSTAGAFNGACGARLERRAHRLRGHWKRTGRSSRVLRSPRDGLESLERYHWLRTPRCSRASTLRCTALRTVLERLRSREAACEYIRRRGLARAGQTARRQLAANRARPPGSADRVRSQSVQLCNVRPRRYAARNARARGPGSWGAGRSTLSLSPGARRLQIGTCVGARRERTEGATRNASEEGATRGRLEVGGACGRPDGSMHPMDATDEGGPRVRRGKRRAVERMRDARSGGARTGKGSWYAPTRGRRVRRVGCFSSDVCACARTRTALGDTSCRRVRETGRINAAPRARRRAAWASGAFTCEREGWMGEDGRARGRWVGADEDGLGVLPGCVRPALAAGSAAHASSAIDGRGGGSSAARPPSLVPRALSVITHLIASIRGARRRTICPRERIEMKDGRVRIGIRSCFVVDVAPGAVLARAGHAEWHNIQLLLDERTGAVAERMQHGRHRQRTSPSPSSSPPPPAPPSSLLSKALLSPFTFSILCRVAKAEPHNARYHHRPTGRCSSPAESSAKTRNSEFETKRCQSRRMRSRSPPQAIGAPRPNRVEQQQPVRRASHNRREGSARRALNGDNGDESPRPQSSLSGVLQGRGLPGSELGAWGGRSRAAAVSAERCGSASFLAPASPVGARVPCSVRLQPKGGRARSPRGAAGTVCTVRVRGHGSADARPGLQRRMLLAQALAHLLSATPWVGLVPSGVFAFTDLDDPERHGPILRGRLRRPRRNLQREHRLRTAIASHVHLPRPRRSCSNLTRSRARLVRAAPGQGHPRLPGRRCMMSDLPPVGLGRHHSAISARTGSSFHPTASTVDLPCSPPPAPPARARSFARPRRTRQKGASGQLTRLRSLVPAARASRRGCGERHRSVERGGALPHPGGRDEPRRATCGNGRHGNSVARRRRIQRRAKPVSDGRHAENAPGVGRRRREGWPDRYCRPRHGGTAAGPPRAARGKPRPPSDAREKPAVGARGGEVASSTAGAPRAGALVSSWLMSVARRLPAPASRRGRRRGRRARGGLSRAAVGRGVGIGACGVDRRCGRLGVGTSAHGPLCARACFVGPGSGKCEEGDKAVVNPPGGGARSRARARDDGRAGASRRMGGRKEGTRPSREARKASRRSRRTTLDGSRISGAACSIFLISRGLRARARHTAKLEQISPIAQRSACTKLDKIQRARRLQKMNAAVRALPQAPTAERCAISSSSPAPSSFSRRAQAPPSRSRALNPPRVARDRAHRAVRRASRRGSRRVAPRAVPRAGEL
ncbi:uncharacterized protein BXZ73DRAFT_77735 [Epithele typhae]|uniref:uncharacterized protein n=1 Tax=Epithele typhae TaxID=378194 RepID=UPI0020080FC5|nr:uncharacterized protein BXZ73DRAFT_77735 [Epithele typhae]KAH9931723.1 hypothetical protein BXZ73DRAFT_77735 [Epithele typhae]